MKIWKLVYTFLVLVIALLGISLIQKPDELLHLVTCDVGQGDATLIVYGQTQILIDGGPDSRVLDCLSRHLPYNDMEIELVILTHPQLDHFGGLIEVFRRYKVDEFIVSRLESGSTTYQALEKEVGGSGAKVVNPDYGMTYRVGKLYFDILHPSRQYFSENTHQIAGSEESNLMSGYASGKDANDFSVVAKLSLGNFDALFTGDIDRGAEEWLLINGVIGPVEYIKIPHHGSKNGLTQDFLNAAAPEVAVISVGKDNRYGLPDNEILEMLADKGVRLLRTDEVDDIEVVTTGDGYKITF